ncbi:2-phospho-L-lactate transferase [Microbulbifer agarilyticus]|uniref:2-phospho-L-lactate transferase n=1 Tax=Microbulbifer agarilyticus TaxID=260552 RepID=A0A1Q2MAG1_9GAMM|nr:2-phospho-L-lactate transferase [Microbulbifer agarilyticus]AQQ69528.1 2-phospho-L-lactate transferase [Microbulbifer agarilyticus]
MQLLPKGKKILALSGGVGGAKLALGLSHCLSAHQLTVVTNTADDFEHLGLSISPDLDTVMYTLAGINDQERGWGISGESWTNLAALERLGGDTWFQLGDQDLATHLIRTQLRTSGKSLSEATAYLCRQLGVSARVLPMSDDPVRTMVVTERGEIGFQQYFVKERCEPKVSGFRFAGVDVAAAHPEFLSLLRDESLAGVVICPSNPFVSVEPLLALNGVREALSKCHAPIIAVSPIVGGRAIKGPTAKMMQELSMPTSATAVAKYYGDVLDCFVLDDADASESYAIQAMGIDTLVTPTVMQSLQDRIELADQVIQYATCFARQDLVV